MWTEGTTFPCHRRRRFLAGIASIIALGTIFHLATRELELEGKPLSHGIHPFSSDWIGIGWDQLDRRSTEVLRKHHAKALPHLVAMLERKGDFDWDDFRASKDQNEPITPAKVIRLWPWEGRFRAAGAIGRMGSLASGAVPMLKKLLLNTTDHAAPAAARALARIEPQGVDVLLATLENGNPSQKELACWGLIDCANLSPKTVRILRETAANGSVWYLRAAAQTFRTHKLPDRNLIQLSVANLNRKEIARSGESVLRELGNLLMMLKTEQEFLAVAQSLEPAWQAKLVEALSRDHPDSANWMPINQN